MGIKRTNGAKNSIKIKTKFYVQDTDKAADEAYVVAILTEWHEYKTCEWETIYTNKYKPAFVFDGRNILDVKN